MRRTPVIVAFAAALLTTGALAAGCTSDDGVATGAAELRFSVTNGVRANPTLVDALQGAIYGNVFLAEDVNLTGPIDGARQFGYVELTAVDLRTAGVESAPWTSAALAAGTYVFLGFFDLDGNGAGGDPDPGDPVTLPVTNQFTIVGGDVVQLSAQFDLVLN